MDLGENLYDLYQEVILDHNKQPRNLRILSNANRRAHGHNSMCGDIVTVFLKIDDARIVRDAAFLGKGCAISIASASMMTEVISKKSEIDILTLFDAFHALCVGETVTSSLSGDLQEALEYLRALSGVRYFPARVKCATLAWHTMVSAINNTNNYS